MPTIKQAAEAHRQYLSVGKLSPDLLRRTVLHSWERSHVSGVSARRPRAVVLGQNDLDRLRDEEQLLLATAKPYMRALSRAAGTARHAVMLGDARSIVLDVVGDERSLRGPESVPVSGSLLDETASGANGFGTTLAEGKYVEIVGPEHFIEGLHPFTCQGIPIRGPDGGVVGVMSVALRRSFRTQRVRELLVCAARGMEVDLLRANIDATVGRALVHGRIDDGILEKLRQDLVQSQAAARLEIELAARSLGRDRVAYAMKLLSLAQQSLATFQRHGAMWRDLSSDERGRAGIIDVGAAADDLRALLKTEAKIQNVSIDVDERLRGLQTFGDSKQLVRTLFQALLAALDAAGAGGVVRIGPGKLQGFGGEVRISVEPASGMPNPALVSSLMLAR